MPRTRRSERHIPLGTRGEITYGRHERGNAVISGPRLAFRVRPVGTHRNDFGTVCRVGRGIEKRLQIRAGPGNEDHQPLTHWDTLAAGVDLPDPRPLPA